MTAYLRRAGFDIVRADYAADHLHVSYVARPSRPRRGRRCRRRRSVRELSARGAVRAERTAIRDARAASWRSIPARGGSKGIHDKNIRPLAGRTLLEYAAQAASESGVVDRIVLSTDSERIAAEGRRIGLEVPFMRPAELAARRHADAAGDRARRRLAGTGRLVAGDHRAAAADLSVADGPITSARRRRSCAIGRRFRRHGGRAAAAPVARLRDADRRRAAGAVSAARVRASRGDRTRGRRSCATGRSMRSGAGRFVRRGAFTGATAGRSLCRRGSRSRSTRRRTGTKPNGGLPSAA